MVHQHTFESYLAGIKSKSFGKRSRLILDAVHHLGTCTEREIKEYLGLKDMNSVRPRVTELRKKNYLVEGEPVIDPVTRKTVRTVKLGNGDALPSTFKERLAAFGFTSYQAYLKSDRWKNFRDSYFARLGKVCFVTGKTDNIDLHHVNYDHICTEWDEDVVPLHRDVHEILHQLVKKYHIPLNEAHVVLKNIFFAFQQS